jgi:hypothetical protein
MHDQAIWDQTVTKDREQHLLKTTNRSGERLFSLVKRLLDDNQRIRAELMTAIAKIRTAKEHPLYFMWQYSTKYKLQTEARKQLDNAPTRADWNERHYVKHSNVRQKEDATKLKQHEKAKEIKPVLAYLKKNGIEETVESMKDFLRKKQQLISSNPNKFHGERLLLGSKWSETIELVKQWIRMEAQYLVSTYLLLCVQISQTSNTANVPSDEEWEEPQSKKSCLSKVLCT